MNVTSQYPGAPIDSLAVGTLVEVDGTHIVADLDSTLAELTRVYNGTIYPIGQFGSILKIHFGRKILFAYVSRLRMKAEFEKERGLPPTSPDARVVEADQFGEAEWSFEYGTWRLHFDRGVATFPLPKQRIYLTPKDELSEVFGRGTESCICLGELVGSGGTSFFLDINELLGKHCAVLGSTGAGKSGTVASVLHSIIDHGKERYLPNWHPSIIVLDPHNEYGAAFRDHSRLSTDEGSLSLPYWLLDLDETVSLIIGKTEYAATSQTNIVKVALTEARRDGARILGIDESQISVDSPIPYVLGNPTGLDLFGLREGTPDHEGFVGHINRQRPTGKNKSENEDFNKVIRKLDALVRDTRLNFMMSSWSEHSKCDDIGAVLSQFLGVGNPIRIVDLSGVPNEVAGAASSAIARLVFNAKVWQSTREREQSPVLLVCEEAHRYVPNSGEAQYAAARQAVQRIAKEGRKYGIGMMLVSQRPSEVDSTVLSQCNSWIVLRIANDTDRAHVRSVLPDSLAGLAKILSGLRQREVIVVGQAASIPARVRVRMLDPESLPNSHDINFVDGWKNPQPSESDLKSLGDRWRFRSRALKLGDPMPTGGTTTPSEPEKDLPF